jgi:hypothetical protein
MPSILSVDCECSIFSLNLTALARQAFTDVDVKLAGEAAEKLGMPGTTANESTSADAAAPELESVSEPAPPAASVPSSTAESAKPEAQRSSTSCEDKASADKSAATTEWSEEQELALVGAHAQTHT